MQSQILKHFEKLSADEICQEPPGKWKDSELFDVVNFFYEEMDIERETAVRELIFSSPENDTQLLDYTELYFELIHDFYIKGGQLDKAHYWLIAALAYENQHHPHPHTIREYQYILAEIYLRQGDYDAGLQIFAFLIQADPGHLETYNTIASLFPKVNLQDLAIHAIRRALELAKKDETSYLLEQVQEAHERLLAEDPPALPDIDSHILAAFHEALTFDPLPEGTTQPEYYPPLITDLLNQGETLDTTLRDTIIRQWKVLVPGLLQVAFAEDYAGTAVNRHAVSLLQQIHDTEPALASLSRWLEQAKDENWHQLLCANIGKIGGYTTAELKTFITDTSRNVYIRNAAIESFLERLSTIPEQRPDIINYFRALLTRKEAYKASEELFTSLLISNLTDYHIKELYPEIKQAFTEDRIDPTVLDLPFIHEEWGMEPLPHTETRQDGIYVYLTCTKCQRTRHYFVQHVTIDMTTYNAQTEGQRIPYDPYIMDRPIICPKCNAVDQYETTIITRLRLAFQGNEENLMAVMLGEEIEEHTPNPFITRIRSQAFGQDMHPLAALNKYKQIALNRPKDAEPHWRMGNILRQIWRDEQAREAYQHSLALDPNELYALYSLAATVHDIGDLSEAQTLYQKTIQRISPSDMMKDDTLIDISLLAAEGLKALKDGLPSPYARDYRPMPEKNLSRKERRAQKKKLRKMQKKKRLS